MTLEQIKETTCSSLANAQKFMEFINDTCERFGIDTPARQLCFLAQTGHESGSLYFTEELASGQAYEGRKGLGNIQPGDGVKFKGRGLIQITGRLNYTKVGNALGVDFISNPTLLGGKNITECSDEQLRNAAMSAGWFWSNRNLNAIADNINIASTIETGSNLSSFILMTKKINGGTNGLPDRLNRYKSGLKLFLNSLQPQAVLS